MSGSDKGSRKSEELGPPPDDKLDAMLREWHQQNAERAAANRDRLVRALAEQGGHPSRTAETDGSPVPARRHRARLRPFESSPPSLLEWATPLRTWATHRLARVAASIVLVVGVIAVLLIPDWPTGRTGVALAEMLQVEVGFARPLGVTGLWPDLDDEAALREAQQTVTEAREELKKARVIGPSEDTDPWIPWTKLYRNLRALGQWDDALEEMHKALAFAKAEDEKPARYSFHYVCLRDLGNTYQALGDYETALAYHQESLQVARNYQEWLLHREYGGDPSGVRQANNALANTLAPQLWSLSTIAAARGDMQLAWDYHNQAGELLADYFRLECEQRGLPAQPDTPLARLCMAVVDDGDKGLESPVVKVREHLLRQAILSRLARDPDAASEALRLGALIPAYPHADQSRLDFSEPMERMRIAIAKGDFTAAVAAIHEAAQNTGPRHFEGLLEGLPDHPPIGVLARAELRFLRGVALAGLDPNDPEALNLIESAIESVKQSAATLPEPRREQLLKRIEEWEEVAVEVRRESS